PIRCHHRTGRPLGGAPLEEQPQQRPTQRQHAPEHAQLRLVRARRPALCPQHVRQQLPILLLPLGLPLRYPLLGGAGHRGPPATSGGDASEVMSGQITAWPSPPFFVPRFLVTLNPISGLSFILAVL